MAIWQNVYQLEQSMFKFDDDDDQHSTNDRKAMNFEK
jgi:hypothetical protein